MGQSVTAEYYSDNILNHFLYELKERESNEKKDESPNYDITHASLIDDLDD